MSTEYTLTTEDMLLAWTDTRATSIEEVPLAAEEFKRWYAAEFGKAIDLGYSRGLRMAAESAMNYRGNLHSVAATLALGFTMAADEIEKDEA